MGRIKRGILGGFSGKVANVIGGSWKGIAYMRSQPLSVAQPNTAAQQTNKTKFSEMVIFAQLILAEFIQPLWNRIAVKMSGYNFFISSNTGAFSSSGLTTPANLIIARGGGTSADIGVASATNGSAAVTVPWTNNTGTGTALADDKAYVLVLNLDALTNGMNTAAVNRSAGTASITMSGNNTTGDTLYIYLAFKSADGLKISETSYRTKVV